MKRTSLLASRLLFAFTTLLLSCHPAHAWGCKGHQTIALIAEKQLTPQARQSIEKLLTDNPVDPKLPRYCGNSTRDLMADGSTWPDDVRGEQKNGPWHYIDIPRDASRATLSQFRGADSCITQAITDQLALLTDKNADPRLRADALRYLIHFVGDLHMPLHATSNNDEGGICVPVRYFRRRAHQQHNSYVPNVQAGIRLAMILTDAFASVPASN